MKKRLQKFVCSECAGDNKLKKDIFAVKKKQKTCSYCSRRRNCICLESLADAVDKIYRENYLVCEDASSPSEIISEMLMLDNSAGSLDIDLVCFLSEKESGSSRYKDEEPMYSYCTVSEKYPQINDGTKHKELWDDFCNQIKHRTRFFNIKIIGWLDRIFFGLDKIKYKSNISAVRIIPKNVIFYRARKASSVHDRLKICCDPTQELTSPPVHLATNGRMNPTGISVFYAAFELETCIAEIRLPVGDMAISGEFKLERPITVFDLTVFDSIDFDKTINPDYDFDQIFGADKNSTSSSEDIDSLEDRLAFLQKFSDEISKPIHPNNEALEYVPTQALVEYLANHYKPNIDAIIYASTQTNRKGRNIVFLNNATNVLKENKHKNGTYKAFFEENHYRIFTHSNDPIDNFYSAQFDESSDITFVENLIYLDQKEYLSFVEGSLKLHEVLAINYEIKCRDVTVTK